MGGERKGECCISSELRGLGLAMVNESVDSLSPGSHTHNKPTSKACRILINIFDTTWARGLTGTKLIGQNESEQPLSMFRVFPLGPSLRPGDVKITHDLSEFCSPTDGQVPSGHFLPSLAPHHKISGQCRDCLGAEAEAKPGCHVEATVYDLPLSRTAALTTPLFYDTRFLPT
jgi:hypothetical protein